MTDKELDYPVAAPDGVAPILYRAQIIQAMALTYMSAVRDMTIQEAGEAAIASWETDWPDAPEPRTIEAGISYAQDDLAYWGED